MPIHLPSAAPTRNVHGAHVARRPSVDLATRVGSHLSEADRATLRGRATPGKDVRTYAGQPKTSRNPAPRGNNRPVSKMGQHTTATRRPHERGGATSRAGAASRATERGGGASRPGLPSHRPAGPVLSERAARQQAGSSSQVTDAFAWQDILGPEGHDFVASPAHVPQPVPPTNLRRVSIAPPPQRVARPSSFAMPKESGTMANLTNSPPRPLPGRNGALAMKAPPPLRLSALSDGDESDEDSEYDSFLDVPESVMPNGPGHSRLSTADEVDEESIVVMASPTAGGGRARRRSVTHMSPQSPYRRGGVAALPEDPDGDDASQEGDTEFIDCARIGKVEPFQALVDEAARTHKPALLERLDITNKLGRTCLHEAAWRGYASLVRVILQARGVRISQKGDYMKKSALHLACDKGFPECVDLLLANDAGVNVGDCHRSHPLHVAASNGYVGCIKSLLKAGADCAAHDVYGCTPVTLAATGGHTQAVDLLLNQEHNCELVDKEGRAPLSWAAGEGHKSTVELLCSRAAEVELQDKKKKTALAWACDKGFPECVDTLLLYGANRYGACAKGWTPLMYCTHNGHLECVKSLRYVPGSQNVNRKDKLARTALHHASITDSRDVVRYLLTTLDADPDVRDSVGHTAKEYATSVQVKRMIERAEMANVDHDRNRAKREEAQLAKQDNIEYMLRNKNNEDEYIEFRHKHNMDIHNGADTGRSPAKSPSGGKYHGASPTLGGSNSPVPATPTNVPPTPKGIPGGSSWRGDELVKKANKTTVLPEHAMKIKRPTVVTAEDGTGHGGGASSASTSASASASASPPSSPPRLQRRGSRASTMGTSAAAATNPVLRPASGRPLFAPAITKSSILALGRKEVLAELKEDSAPVEAKYMSHASTPQTGNAIASRQRRLSVIHGSQ